MSTKDFVKPARSFGRTRPRPARRLRATNRKSAVATSWDPLAEWYDGWMGQEGSKHHQLVMPTVLELLAVEFGDTVLDLGCGQGVLAEPVVKAGGRYLGVDASNTLIDIAWNRHNLGRSANFIVGDVTKLDRLEDGDEGIAEASADAVVFLLSIQDIDPLEKAIASAVWALKPGGRLVMLMTHPAFRIPRQSGWGFDEKRKMQYRRIDNYLSCNKIPLKEFPGDQKGVSFSFHRPLSVYFEAMTQNGLVIDGLKELSTAEWVTNQTPRAQGRAAREIPLFLALRARKQ